jgi:hypothetical protein
MNKRYWLRGASIYFILGTVFYVVWITKLSNPEITVISSTQNQFGVPFGDYIELLGYVLFLPLEEIVGMIFGFSYDLPDSITYIILFFASAVFWVTVGAILGSIYGKIKNRNIVNKI